MSKSSKATYSLGVDFGTNSVRALIVNTADGEEIASAVFDYPSGEHGVLLDSREPNLARQNPADNIEGFYCSVSEAVRTASRRPGFSPDKIVGIGIDATGSTPIPVDRQGMPLAMLPEFRKNPAAGAWLWKDHTAHAEAAEITALAAKSKHRYLDFCGGAYSSEWFWSKILHCLRCAPRVFDAAYSWVEQSDFIPGLLTGKLDPDYLPRCICAAGHKCMYGADWGGLPDAAFLAKLDPKLVRLRDTFLMPARTADQPAGRLTAEIALRVGLPAGLPVAVGIIDAHAGAIGAGIKPGTLVKILGTSSCDMLVAPMLRQTPKVPGLCGIVPGSIVPGLYGFEAGQSAVGDIFNWFTAQLAPICKGEDPHESLSRQAAELLPGQSGLLALDWNNGNRSVLTDPLLSGLLVGQTLHTTAAEVYRTLVEATAFGALKIIERVEQCGIEVREVVNCGGIAEKNPLVMQIYADVCNRPMKLSRSSQTCALGAAICGAVVGGAYAGVPQAQRRMTGVKAVVYRPRRRATAVYAELYHLYTQLHDAFGLPGNRSSLANVMKDLIALRDKVRRESK